MMAIKIIYETYAVKCCYGNSSGDGIVTRILGADDVRVNSFCCPDSVRQSGLHFNSHCRF